MPPKVARLVLRPLNEWWAEAAGSLGPMGGHLVECDEPKEGRALGLVRSTRV